MLALHLITTALAASEPLTLDQVLGRARTHAPSVVLALRAVDEAEAGRVGQGLPLFNPRLAADWRPMAVELPGQPVDPRHGYLVGLDGTFEVSGAGAARLTEVDRRVTLAREEARLAALDAVAQAWALYVEALLADERVAGLEATLALQVRVETAAKERLAQGDVGEPDVTTTATDVAAVRVELAEARRAAAAARVSLTRTLGLPPTGCEALAHVDLGLAPSPSEEVLVARALERRPELAVLRARLSAAEALEDRLGREAFPRLGYNVGLDAAPASPVFGFLGLSVELPLFQRNQAGRAVAQALQASERLRLDTQLADVRRQVTLARTNYDARREQVELLAGQALPNARRTQELIEAGWRAGRFDVFRLTTATRELLRLERERVEAALAAWKDFIELERVSGGLSP